MRPVRPVGAAIDQADIGGCCLRLIAAVLACVFLASAVPAYAQFATSTDDPAFLDLQVGVRDIRNYKVPAVDLEYRSDYQFFFIKPIVGILVSTRDAVYGYGGLAMDIFFGSRFVMTPSLAVGAYYKGHDVNLGTWLPEFRSAVELAYRFDDRSRLGIMFNHISNAGIGKSNSGTETAMLTYSYPITKLQSLLNGQ
jgi:lipid A 3-O-deacylase